METQPPEMQQASMHISAGTIIVYKNQETESNCTDSCAVCLEEFKDGDRCRVLSKCNHQFHQLYIDLWLVKAMYCPLRRGSIHDLEPTTPINAHGKHVAARFIEDFLLAVGLLKMNGNSLTALSWNRNPWRGVSNLSCYLYFPFL
ncbi:RING-H2 finger protein ATL79-like [Durio zibethinus]|uniref:RING-type E3 ubiquitin transferase n=1 Tax=Durio zibethinus TaxID=66656 RepID=A0A6P5ZLB5_DURZI|nr:RING-H2 finger protein ATL79-like [Durio zibethinus]